MVKKYVLAAAFLLFFGVGLVNAQNNQDTFPKNKCVSVDAVYLSDSKSGELKLFPAEKQKDETHWTIKVDTRLIVEEFIPLDSTVTGASPADWKFTSDDVVQRFNFGSDKTPLLKKYCVEFQEAIPVGENGELAKSIGGDSGIDLIKNYVAMIYKAGVVLLGLVCVLVIVISGVQISAGGASPDKVSDAKSRIAQALFSLILLFASAMILKAINPGFFL